MLRGNNTREILEKRKTELECELNTLINQLSKINYLMEDINMQNEITIRGHYPVAADMYTDARTDFSRARNNKNATVLENMDSLDSKTIEQKRKETQGRKGRKPAGFHSLREAWPEFPGGFSPEAAAE